MRAQKLFIGRKLRDIRQEAGLTQSGFAGKLGISVSYLSQLETTSGM